MLPDMSDTLDEWAVPVKVKTVTRITSNFAPVDTVTQRTINAVVQVAQKNSLKSDQIDWSLRYLTVHTISMLENGEFVEYNGEDYKVIDNGDWSAYGFTEALVEQTKKPLLVVT